MYRGALSIIRCTGKSTLVTEGITQRYSGNRRDYSEILEILIDIFSSAKPLLQI